LIEQTIGLQCGRIAVEHFPPLELATRVVELGKVTEGRWLAVERNNHGYGGASSSPGPGIRKHLREQDGKLGWLTSAASRPAMIENMGGSVMAEPKLFHSPRLLQECRTFVRHRTGTLRQRIGAHDDCVMAMAIALAVAGKTWTWRKEEGAADNEFDAVREQFRHRWDCGSRGECIGHKES